jgi:hypothetical protein
MELQKLKDLIDSRTYLAKQEQSQLKGGIGDDDVEVGIGSDDMEVG